VSLYLFVLGVGIGSSMQVLVLAVQNAVDYKDLGAGTSGSTFFRSIGGSFGTAVFGAVFSNVLAGDIARALHGVSLPSGITAGTGASPAVLAHLPPAVHAGYIAGFSQALHTVFVFATPIGAVAFLLTFLLKEVPLRETSRAVDRADSTAPTSVPATRDSAQEMERALLTLFGRERRREVYENLATAADVHVSPRGCWLLYRIADHSPITETRLARLLHVEKANLAGRLAELIKAGYVTRADGASADRGALTADGAPPASAAAPASPPDGGAGPAGAAGPDGGAGPDGRARPAGGDGALADVHVALTPAGQQAAIRLDAAREAGIERLMTGWHPDMNPQLRQVLKRITTTLVATDGRGLDPAPAAGPTATGS
jgi:DNA-binding MarR family transcriptional regulator